MATEARGGYDHHNTGKRVHYTPIILSCYGFASRSEDGIVRTLETAWIRARSVHFVRLTVRKAQ